MTKLLDGTRLEYTYEALGTVRVVFADGEVGFEWLAGPLAGESGSGFTYHVEPLRAGQFFVHWHEPEMPGAVTLVYDLEAGRVCSSVLAAYGTEAEQRMFETARIERVEGPLAPA